MAARVSIVSAPEKLGASWRFRDEPLHGPLRRMTLEGLAILVTRTWDLRRFGRAFYHEFLINFIIEFLIVLIYLILNFFFSF